MQLQYLLQTREAFQFQTLNSKFRNLFANKTAGAIGVNAIFKLTISGCEFYNVSSEKNGGAIFADVNDEESYVIVRNSKFNDCTSEFGGAILQLGGTLAIKNSDFVENSVEYDGGAIYTSFTSVDISNSSFKSNLASNEISYGGAGYFDMGTVIIRQAHLRIILLLMYLQFMHTILI